MKLSLAAVLAAASLTGCVARGAFQASAGSVASTGGAPAGEPVAYEAGDPGAPPPVGAPAAARPGMQLDDFAFALKEYTGSYTPAYVAQQLTKFEVAPACMARMAANGSAALHAASFYTRYVMAYAKTVTGEDWDRIETQNNNDREHNKHLVAPMVEQFRQRFHVTVAVEGDDCRVEQGALWISYWTTIGEAVSEHPPQSGTAIIHLHVTPAARDITVQVDPTGSKFTITAPRDIEPADWSEKLEKPFRRLARSI